MTAAKSIGPRLRQMREQTDMSLRAVARELGVSPAFLSQIEHGKSQPSVATLYALARLFGAPLDAFFDAEEDAAPKLKISDAPLSRNDFASPMDIDWGDRDTQAKISFVRPDDRLAITMQEGVRWEKLAATPDASVTFVEVIYEPGAMSADRGVPLVHEGYEYAYALAGELQITIGDVALTLRAGDTIGFNSSIPHFLRNTGTTDFRGVWFVHASRGLNGH